jgi:CheY-like chemotaxis protein
VFPRSGSCIFVVDDEPVIASSLAAILQMNGFSARFFTCPLEALAAALSESPGLVISDVAMPGISGMIWQSKLENSIPTARSFRDRLPLWIYWKVPVLKVTTSAYSRSLFIPPSLFQMGQLSAGLLQALTSGESLIPGTT